MKITVLSLFVTLLLIGPGVAQVTTRVSVDAAGGQVTGSSARATLSGDGRFVAFHSSASDLVQGDNNRWTDVFVRDRRHGTVRRVSLAFNGGDTNADSIGSMISRDGSAVAFASNASNVVPGDTNGAPDVFVHDLGTGLTERVNVDSSGNQSNLGAGPLFAQAPTLSGDGRYVAFFDAGSNLVSGDTNGTIDCFVHDRISGATTRVSVDSSGNDGNQGAAHPWISETGRFVVFASLSTNLVLGDTNNISDVFLHDRSSGLTTRVSTDSAGNQVNTGFPYGSVTPFVSADGNIVAFTSYASDLVPGDTNNSPDVFVKDRVTGQTTRVSVASDGSQAQGDSDGDSLSADGLVVSFTSLAPNLVPGDTNAALDSFVHDRASGTTRRVSVSSLGQEGNGLTVGGHLAADNGSIAFESFATNLVAGDTNTFRDVFVHGREITLEITPNPARTGDLMSVATWGGQPGTCVLTAIVDVNGTPTFLPLTPVLVLDGAGQAEKSGVLPLSPGVPMDFQSFAFSVLGGVAASNVVQVDFQ